MRATDFTGVVGGLGGGLEGSAGEVLSHVGFEEVGGGVGGRFPLGGGGCGVEVVG